MFSREIGSLDLLTNKTTTLLLSLSLGGSGIDISFEKIKSFSLKTVALKD